MIPRATYRLQLTRDFPFSAAQAILPYLADLGISHIYASPVTTARGGSTHGYDVTDPTRINPELGGEEGFRSLAAAARARGLGIVIDIVPNHMGVAGGKNLYWNDVLRLGRDSPYARWFDIDWGAGPLILPILGATLSEVIEAGDIALVPGGEPHLLLYGEQRLPLRPDISTDLPLRDLLDAQHYALVHWRTANDRLNWRRFFAINELAALRVEDRDVFDATHRLYLDLYRERLIDGVRVDHVDGLTDPAAYCRRLRGELDAIRPGAWIIVEKILGADETLPTDWGVDGTSGYDAMRDLTALLHDPAGEAPLRDLWRALDPDHADPAQVVLDARRDMLSWQFDAQLTACVAALAALFAGDEAITPAMLRRAIERLLWVFPVYRTYGDGATAPETDAAQRDRAWRMVERHLPPGEAPVARRILDRLAGSGEGDPALAAEAVRRFQQLSAPIAAKGVEDTAFYRYATLLSANDVGSDPEQFALSPDDFHQRAAARPLHAMLATATHDHKRGEDVRARLAVLSAVPDLWTEAVTRWSAIADTIGHAVHPADRYQLFQSLFGAWPLSGAPAPDFATRIAAWQEKSLREARLRSSWEAPDTHYEAATQALLRDLLAHKGFRDDLGAFLALIAPAAQANSLVQVALKYMLPGIPDLYQGAELADLSLVDPDNRRPVDYARRQALLRAPDGSFDARKLALIRDALALRGANPLFFSQGDYHPLPVTGPRAAHVLAFVRRHGGKRLLCAVMLRAVAAIVEARGLPGPDWWAGTRIGGQEGLSAATLFTGQPFFIDLGE
ncbi:MULTISPECIES: malto-oligosyltrehalose synthase [unclassified Sphingobium]|uniref:malto-oligosyltrehalose synthase n=1 Tax=unclassified Sphingobium TaxID=2611147 RepID=UPI0035A64057